VVEHLPSICEALDFTERWREGKKEKKLENKRNRNRNCRVEKYNN
jgi:hypothetical protein